MIWFSVRDIGLATFQRKSAYRSVMVASSFHRWILLNFGYVGHIDELFIMNGGDLD